MKERQSSGGFAARPGDAERWVRAPEHTPVRPPTAAEEYPARLTIDVTVDMRGRIKIAAFQRGQTVADMLRALFEREFPAPSGEKE
ncbi:hypothetical protein HL653_04410 [Sphingomonas sp. AP4-R1]|uniref:hypothetical protein n=1 Tax=Sphingomonas sp. AP4-R1 TaxID=2735134 RepID=UPI0014938C83|nr:hypothetical protein [Sphingomonas sp. AP4-R1]QJU57129.1 hypothetical protein HL653_04410 [Sphingomonas sp. AP4-R1]